MEDMEGFMLREKSDGFEMTREKLRTPCYLIDKKEFIENCKRIMTAFEKEWGSNMEYGYSIKTNHHKAFMQMARSLGWKMEAVSEDEIMYARELACPYRDMIYNGPVKGAGMYPICEEGGIVNLDNLDEVHRICRFLTDNKIAGDRLQIGLRVNFDIASRCLGEIDPGAVPGRFGLSYENGDLKAAICCLKENGIVPQGLHMHTSTKSRSTNIFKELARMVCSIAQEYELDLKFIDMGGGFFGGGRKILPGRPSMEEYAQAVCGILRKCFEPGRTKLVLEPGASVIATAARYYTKVSNIRNVQKTRVVTLDGTLLHINPFMVKRDSVYELCGEREREKCGRQIVCGCTCMEKDRFFESEDAERIDEDDTLCFKNAGAYTMAFNSSFILRPPAVYVWDGEGETLQEWKE